MPAHRTVTPIIIVRMRPNVRRDLARLRQLDHAHGAAAFPMYYLYSLQAPEPRQRLEIAAPAVPAIPISAAVPATISSPSSPCLVIVVLAVGISRIPVLAKGLLGVMAGV
jgi:hypothetical protein